MADRDDDKWTTGDTVWMVLGTICMLALVAGIVAQVVCGGRALAGC